MIPDLDTYRTANILVKRHDQDALVHAAMGADAMLGAGDVEGWSIGLGKLPPTYETKLWQTKCDHVFQHVFDAYAGEGRSIYEEAA